MSSEKFISAENLPVSIPTDKFSSLKVGDVFLIQETPTGGALGYLHRKGFRASIQTVGIMSFDLQVQRATLVTVTYVPEQLKTTFVKLHRNYDQLSASARKELTHQLGVNAKLIYETVINVTKVGA